MEQRDCILTSIEGRIGDGVDTEEDLSADFLAERPELVLHPPCGLAICIEHSPAKDTGGLLRRVPRANGRRS